MKGKRKMDTSNFNKSNFFVSQRRDGIQAIQKEFKRNRDARVFIAEKTGQTDIFIQRDSGWTVWRRADIEGAQRIGWKFSDERH
jgi:hypothetical protein